MENVENNDEISLNPISSHKEILLTNEVIIF